MESKEYLEWCKINNLDSSIINNYYKYQNEMEYLNYLKYDLEDDDPNENKLKEQFIKLLKSTKREGIDNLINWLENETDFFNAPASSKYHLAVEGGLLQHSLNVFNELIKECEVSDTTIIVSLLHDICKINSYKKSSKNVQNKEGKWEKIPCYISDETLPLGHSEKSIILIQKFIKLTDEEITTIRWHMGGFEPKENYRYLNGAFNKYELAVRLHIADLKATYIIEK